MFILELTLKNTPLSLSVQRQSADDAQATYQQIVEAMRGSNQLLELTCDKQPERKLAVFSDSLAAVQVYDKTAATTGGRQPGFFALAE